MYATARGAYAAVVVAEIMREDWMDASVRANVVHLAQWRGR
ncbi:MAG: hypothetical protein AVDCRST_MAG26-1583 [uncultured Chloroflexia bacterium]|uniref:Uncharacterized protein n=1 Tax=uncultured Chloroflexia bacterium TaxID=1672391 RepID=A0A6J4I8X4_9CHLR|nr:MAG: hypothetical protein AVDCRST_MAG26-1583 [uncultured Chloroflexia bacterium]